MRKRAKQHIFFVDDVPNVCKTVRRTLIQAGFDVSCFTRAIDCLTQLEQSENTPCNLLITDVKMPDMDGIELLKKARRIAPLLPVLVITGFGDIPMAVKAMKAGATNFIEKNQLSRQNLLSTVKSLLKKDGWANPRLEKLFTKTEKIILRLILAGKTSREIAIIRNCALSTIEDHRNNIYRKAGVHNLAGLFKWAYEAELLPVNR
jgi:two-component system response regulator TtrR